jgi:hypothetical protein
MARPGDDSTGPHDLWRVLIPGTICLVYGRMDEGQSGGVTDASFPLMRAAEPNDRRSGALMRAWHGRRPPARLVEAASKQASRRRPPDRAGAGQGGGSFRPFSRDT